jgi:hypothetical protein
MKALCSSEVMVENYQNAWHHMPEDHTPHLALGDLILCHCIGHA